MIRLGEKIKALRKQKNISQEVLAGYLGVTFQAVSKWETGTAMPDVTLIPAMASFFGVSTDELFDFNVYAIDKNVQAIVAEHSRYWDSDKAKSEQILRDGLKQYPGNDVLLNCLIGVIPIPERGGEVIELCKTLIGGTHLDDVKYDAYRIMAEAYQSMGEYSLAKEAIEAIPEIYFSKLGVAARLLKGEDKLKAAAKQKVLSFEELIDMCEIWADYYAECGEADKAKRQLIMEKNLIEACKADSPTAYTRNLYACFSERLKSIEERIDNLAE